MDRISAGQWNSVVQNKTNKERKFLRFKLPIYLGWNCDLVSSEQLNPSSPKQNIIVTFNED